MQRCMCLCEHMFSFLYKLCFDSQVIKRRMYPTKVYVKLQKLSAQTQLCSIGVCVCCMLVCFNRSFNAICARKSRSRSNTLLVVVFVSFFFLRNYTRYPNQTQTQQTQQQIRSRQAPIHIRWLCLLSSLTCSKLLIPAR